MQVFSALQNLHTALVHGDVNTGNIVWDPSGHFFQFVDLEFATWAAGPPPPAAPPRPPSPPVTPTAAPSRNEFWSPANGRSSKSHSTASHQSTAHSTPHPFASPAASSRKARRSPGSPRASAGSHPSPLSTRGAAAGTAALGHVGEGVRALPGAGGDARAGGAHVARVVSPGLVSWPLTATAHGSTAAGRLAPHGTLELASFNQLKGCGGAVLL